MGGGILRGEYANTRMLEYALDRPMVNHRHHHWNNCPPGEGGGNARIRVFGYTRIRSLAVGNPDHGPDLRARLARGVALRDGDLDGAGRTHERDDLAFFPAGVGAR